MKRGGIGLMSEPSTETSFNATPLTPLTSKIAVPTPFEQGLPWVVSLMTLLG